MYVCLLFSTTVLHLYVSDADGKLSLLELTGSSTFIVYRAIPSLHSSLIFYRSQSVGINPTSDTVEPLVDNGHGGDDCFVYCWEIVLSSYHNIKSWISDMRVSPLQGRSCPLVESLKLRRM